MSEGDKEAPSFKVVDKRRFTADGQTRPDARPDEVRAPILVNGGKPQPGTGPNQGQSAGFAGPGGPRGAQSAPPQAQPQQRPPPQRAEAPAEPRQAPPKPRQAPQSGIDFLSFVASLATNAMAAMGALPDAQARGMPVDPRLAREYIEIIAMLQERTQGNLSAEEEAALTRLLNDLKLTFVEVQQHAQRAAAAKRPPGLP